MNRNTLIATVAALSIVPAAAHAVDGYQCTLSPASTGSYNVNATAPFSGSMVGNAAATPATRTKTGSIVIFPPSVNCGTFGPTQNDPLTISGSITGTGTGNNIHPTGTFAIFIDTGAGTASVQGLTLNLLGASTASVAGGLSNFRYPTFCTVNPSCSLPFLTPISLSVGTLDITALTATQGGGTAIGTLTPGMMSGFDFSVPVSLTTTTTASFNGAPFAVDPQVLPLVFTGHIEIPSGGATAIVTSNIALNIAPPSPAEPVVLPPTPFTTPTGTPLCAGLNLLLNLTVTSTTITVGTTAALTAPGTRLACACDWNRNGDVTVQDIFDYLASYFAGNGDFNGVGGTTIQDIFDFLACYFGRPLPC